MRIVVTARQQVRQFGDDPIRFDAGVGERPHFLGVQQGGGQHPRWRFRREFRTGEQLELAAARAVVDAASFVGTVAAIADLGRQPGDQRAVQQ